MQLVIQNRFLYSYLMSTVLFLNIFGFVIASSEQTSSQAHTISESIQEVYKPVGQQVIQELTHEELVLLAEKYGISTHGFSDVEIKDIIINFIYSSEYQDAVRSLGDYSLEQLYQLAERHGVPTEGLSKEQLQIAVLRRIVSTVRPTPIIPGSDVSAQKTEIPTLLLAAIMRRVGLLINENTQKNNTVLTWILTLPLRYTFPFLMTEESGEARKMEAALDQFGNELSPATKKLIPLAFRLPGTYMGAGYDLERLFLQEEYGYMLGSLAEISLIKLLPTLAYNKYQKYQHPVPLDEEGNELLDEDGNKFPKHPIRIYAEREVGRAILESADIGYDIVRTQARRLLDQLIGNNIIKTVQDATSDIVNFELMDIGFWVLKQKAVQTDFCFKKGYLDSYAQGAHHPTLKYYGAAKPEEQEAFKEEVIKDLLIHAATGPLTIMMQTKQGDILTKGIRKVGDLLGKFFVAIGLCKKSTLQTTVGTTKALIQNFIAPLMIRPSVLEELHEMMRTGNFTGWQKNKEMTRSIARYIVKNLLNMVWDYQLKSHTKHDNLWILGKVSALLTLWYLYHSEGAVSLQSMMMGGDGEKITEEQLRAYQEAMAAYQAEMARGAAVA